MLDVIIDISKYQLLKNLEEVKKEGIVAIIQKATQGSTIIDPTFKIRQEMIMRDNDFLFGAYHFGTSDSKGNIQANHFLNTVGDVISGEIDETTLLVLDWEDYKGSIMQVMEVISFLETIVERTGRYPVLYTRKDIIERFDYKKYYADIIFKCKLWLARYSNVPPVIPKGWDQWFLWQYTDKGRINGISYPVDRNKFYSDDLKELYDFWNVPYAGKAIKTS